MEPSRLSDRVRLDLVFEDTTPLGSMLSGRCEQVIRERASAVADHRNLHGHAATVAASERLLSDAMASGRLGDFYRRNGTLDEAHLYPSPDQVHPVALRIELPHNTFSVPLASDLRADLARWLGDWQRGIQLAPRAAAARELIQTLTSLGAMTTATPPPRCDDDALFVGHATVRLGGRGRSVLVDPFVLPQDGRDPESYRALAFSELAPDGVVITHAHPDHFDLGTLLRLGADTPIRVPRVERESILSVDMASRLTDLGFRNVETLAPFEELRIGDTRVVALPFHGEQPTTGETNAPDVRNVGLTYWVEAKGRRYVLLADAGADASGSSRGCAEHGSPLLGGADVVFGGYRSWSIYPIRYLFSSVSRYLLFVPKAQWSVRQTIMNTPDDLLDVAELWGAQCVVPYADGGAPWYWRRGLGPRLDGTTPDNPHLDPRPERVATAAARRSAAEDGDVASPVEVRVLRPGQCLGRSYEAAAAGGRSWPYGAEEAA